MAATSRSGSRSPRRSTKPHYRIEQDLDGNGSLENVLVPVYDQTGNLAAVTDAAGKPVERYDYSPYGEQLILVDSTPPEVTQVRVEDGELWVEVSEDIVPDALSDAASGGLVTLVDDATQQALPISVSQPVLTGRMARRRVVITTTDPPAAGTALTLRFETSALRDPFANALATPLELSFNWSDTDTVVSDAAAPTWQQVTVEDDHLVFTFSEEIDAATAASGVTVDGAAVTWTVEPNRYELRTSVPLAVGGHNLEITTTVADLDGQPLVSGLSAAFSIDAAGSSFLVDQVPDPRRIAATATGNLYGFHGRPLDPETGFLYFRNRYYDPDLGRFLSVDPMGFVDGPSPYAFAGNGPFDNSDPLGLCIGLFEGTEFCQNLRGAVDQAVDNFIDENFSDDRTTRNSLQFVKGQVKALLRQPKNAIDGISALWDAVTHPEETIEKAAEAVTSFSFDEMKGEMQDAFSQYLEGIANSSPEKQGEMFGEAVMTGVVSAGLSKVSSLTKATSVRKAAGAPRSQKMHGSVGRADRDRGTTSAAPRRVSDTCGFTCFAAGTLVATEDGLRPIEEIEVGDRVWAYDEETGETRLAEVARVFERSSLEVWTLDIGGELIETTGEHPFWVVGRGWVEVADLRPGDILTTYEGQELRLVAVERQERVLRVYNFEVRGLHTYFVGDARILVHNCRGGKNYDAEFYRNQYRRVSDVDELEPADVFIDSTNVVRLPHPSKHNVLKAEQMDVLNNWQRSFVGVNYHGRQVDVYWKDGLAVITQGGAKNKIITAYRENLTRWSDRRNWRTVIQREHFNGFRRNQQR